MNEYRDSTINIQEFNKQQKIIGKTFTEASMQNVQDMLLIEGERPVFTIKGKVTKDSTIPKWTRETFNVLIVTILHGTFEDYTDNFSLDFLKSKVKSNYASLTDEYIKQEVYGSHDFKLNFGDSTFRCHLFTGINKSKDNRGGVQLVMNVRTHPNKIPKLEDLNLPDLEPIFQSKSGLVLVSGSANAGKTTTVVSIIDRFNHMTDKHRIIVTAEDPVEYIIPNNHAFIIQKQIGGINGNADSFKTASDDALRENADIIYIGELRSKEEILNALRLADLGKLVIATIHATSVPDTIERITGEFLGVNADQIRNRLLNNLLGIIHQSLFTQKNEQYPLASMLLVTSEDVRKALLNCTNRQELDNFMLTGDAKTNNEHIQNPFSHVLHPIDGFNLLVEEGILSPHDKSRFFKEDDDKLI